MKNKLADTVNTMQSQIDFLTKKLDFISHNAETIIQGRNIKSTIRDILVSIRDYYHADSAYIFEINYEDKTLINTFETYAEGVDSEKQHTDQLPFSFLTFWEKEWGLDGYLCVPDLSKYPVKNPELAAPYIKLMSEQGIRSLVYVPLLDNHCMKGFIGVDNARVYADDVDFIITMGHYISLQLARKQQEIELYKQFRKMEAFIDSISTTSLFTAQVNVTKNQIENIHGTAVLPDTKEAKLYTENVELFCHRMDVHNRAMYRQCFGREALLTAFAANKEKVSEEVYYQDDTGHFIWARSTARLLHHPDTGDIIAFLYQADITREKIQETVMKSVISKEYDYLMCIHGLENTCSLISNNLHRKDCEEMYSSNDYLGTIRSYAKKYLRPEDQDDFVKFLDPDNIWHELETKGSCSTSFCIYIDGEPYYKKLDCYCINREYRLFLHVRTDFTEIHKLRQEQEKKLVRALAEAERANAAKSVFLSCMSHDIRTPLNGIIGMTTLARSSNQDKITASYLDKINISGHFLLDLVNDILDLNQIDAGKTELHPEPYGEKEFIAYIDSVIRPLCDAKEIKLQMKPFRSDYWVYVDKLKFNQIFLNILSNAIKFTENGGHISMHATRKMENDKMFLTSTIEDDGIGMSGEFQKRLFNPFEQAHTKRDDNREGSGLGLAIAYRLIQLMGGTIAIKSNLGKGTTVTINLPLPLMEKPRGNKKKITDNINFEGRHILIAEDNDINGEILKVLLEQKGAAVTIAHDGKSVLKLFKESEPFTYAAILMDMRMPVMDGIAATKAIRRLPQSDAATIPIIAVTANAYGDDIKDCLDAGMNGHMSKPIEAKDLYHVLISYLEG